jgi:glycosyltransferase involved in cell wall biosynthesis
MGPPLSVITPVFNGADFVDRCYNLLCRQTFRDWEWIVTDDGSTDATWDKLAAIKDSRLRLFRNRLNRGRGFSRTRCLAEAHGEWVVIWDVDDLYFPDRLQSVEAARAQGYDFCCSYAVVVDNQLQIKGFRGYIDIAGFRNTFVHPTLAARLSLARSIGYRPELSVGEDATMIWSLAAGANGKLYDDAFVIYQEEREVHLHKAIGCNWSHFRQLLTMRRNAAAPVAKQVRWSLIGKWFMKVVLLNAMRPMPGVYLRTIAHRDYGRTREGWTLSPERVAFLKEMQSVYHSNQEKSSARSAGM